MFRGEFLYHDLAYLDDSGPFRGEYLYNDRLVGVHKKVVSIFVTAGDAGLTNGWWQAREVAACSALAIGSLNVSSSAADPSSPAINLFNTILTSEQVLIKQHLIQKYSFSNNIMYFMRLPEYRFGNYQGKSIPLSAIDGSTTYANWGDFVHTLQQIMALETATTQNAHPWVNASDYNRKLNPKDHVCHYAVADALRSFVAPTYNRAWWISYDTANRPVNLSGRLLYQKRALYYNHVYTFGARAMQVGCHDNAKVVVDSTYVDKLATHHWNQWGNKSYYRTVYFDSPDV